MSFQKGRTKLVYNTVKCDIIYYHKDRVVGFSSYSHCFWRKNQLQPISRINLKILLVYISISSRVGESRSYWCAITKMIFALVSFLSFDATWTDSSSFCVWASPRRDWTPELVVTTGQILPLHLSFWHPNPMDICLSWISESSSPAHPCLHGNWVDEY